jgi:hypothetical protein
MEDVWLSGGGDVVESGKREEGVLLIGGSVVVGAKEVTREAFMYAERLLRLHKAMRHHP